MKPKTIEFNPYRPISNIKESFGIIDVTSERTRIGYYEEDNIVTVRFVNCWFKKLIITSSEEIAFPEVALEFKDCIIEEVEIHEVMTKSLCVTFFRSIVLQCIAESKRLNAVYFDNCLTNITTLTDIAQVGISYESQIVKDGYWKNLCEKFNVAYDERITNPDLRFVLEGVKTIRCVSDYEGMTGRIYNPNIEIIYNLAGDDESTIISNMGLRTLVLKGSPAGSISIDNTEIDNWHIHGFNPTAKNISFSNIRPLRNDRKTTQIAIHLSNLDNVDFDNISFNMYSRISFYRTKFSKAIFTSCDFPKTYTTFSTFVPLHSASYPEKRVRNNDKAQYEIFLQLKKAMDDLGNFHESQKFQSLAHEALRKIKDVSCADRSILKINSWSNDHGLSIRNPFLGFLAFSIPWYLLYLLSIGRLFQPTTIDWNLVGYYFAFADITHRSDFLVDKSALNGWSLSLDYFGKLGIGFFIYQFIAAFRKYGKR